MKTILELDADETWDILNTGLVEKYPNLIDKWITPQLQITPAGDVILTIEIEKENN